ncbi:MAG: glycosyltransferase family 2 protein [Phycisphaerales bacterium]|nr:glycosyltransferase family 2 protein [Phycisphaerales bacterium]
MDPRHHPTTPPPPAAPQDHATFRSPSAVTIIIPCFNYGRFVTDAARSALEQQDATVHVVIVNDGSTDASTADACDACLRLPGAAGHLRVIHQTNAGLACARNAGAAGASTEFLLFLDADDHLLPTCVRDLAAIIRTEESAGRGGDISHAYGQQVLSELGHGTWEVPDWDPILLGITNLHAPTALARRERFEAVGGYTPSMRHGYEDWDFWLKFAERGWRGVRLRAPTYVWRRHSHETMIHQAVKIHDELYARIIDQHREFYKRHALELVQRANQLLHRCDGTWLDENLDAIPIRDLRRWCADLVRERDSARHELSAAVARAESSTAQTARLDEELRRLHSQYEAKPAVRLSRKIHSIMDSLPRPLSAPARGLMRILKRGV